jgi:NDP-sugar pyrophosphorylase family protein
MRNLTALILAGGAGTRLAGLHPDLPKALVPVMGEPFLHWLLLWLRQQGLSDFVFSLGYRGRQIADWLEETGDLAGATWKAVHEETPLGTGGGMRRALDDCQENVLVINGDALLHTPLEPARAMFADPGLDGVLLGVPVNDAARFGTLAVDGQGRLTAFLEKRSGSGLVNAGLYFLRKSVLETFPLQQTLSMEYDVIPDLLAAGRKIAVYSVAADTPFIDIGTPESAAAAHDFIARHILKAA